MVGWLIFAVFLSRLSLGNNPEPADMYDDEVAVGTDPYEVALAEDQELEREVSFYNGDDLKDSTEPWDMTSENDNYEGVDDVEDLDQKISTNRLMDQDSHEKAVSQSASKSEKKQKTHKKKKKKKSSIKKKMQKSKELNDMEREFSIASQDDEITQMQQSIETDQGHLQSLMEDFEKKLNAYENSKVSLSSGIVDSEDSDDEVAVGSISSSEDTEFDDIPSGILDDLPEKIFEDFDEMPVGWFEDPEEMRVGENFDYDEWLEKQMGEMPLEYQQWREEAVGDIEKMEDNYAFLDDPDLDLQDFAETLVGDTLEELHSDMNDMFDILYRHNQEDAVGDDWLDNNDEDDLEVALGDWLDDEDFI